MYFKLKKFLKLIVALSFKVAERRMSFEDFGKLLLSNCVGEVLLTETLG